MKKRYALTIFLVLLASLLVVNIVMAEGEVALQVLSVTDVSPSSLSPGESDTLEIKIENEGDFDAENVLVAWIDPKGAISSVGTGNTKSIGNLDHDDSETLEFDITADSNAEPGLYQLTITMSYVINGTPITQVANAGIKVGGDTDFEVILSDVEVGKVSLSIINVGGNPAKVITVKLPKQDGYEPIGSAAMSLGNLAADDYVIVPFDVKVLDRTKDLEIEISYTDTNGNRKTVTKNVELESYSIDMITGAHVKESSSGISIWGILFAIAAVSGIGYYIYNRRKRKKLENEID